MPDESESVVERCDRIHGLREVLLAPAVIAIVLRQIFRGSAN